MRNRLLNTFKRCFFAEASHNTGVFLIFIYAALADARQTSIPPDKPAFLKTAYSSHLINHNIYPDYGIFDSASRRPRA